jgi:hypothetical protein
MATDPTQTLVPQLARVWLAPVGTTAPDGPVITMPTGWRDVGLFTPDSLNWATDPNFEEVRSHQSYYAVRRFQTTDSATLEVDLQEWSGDNLIAVYGGGTIETVTPSGGGTDYYRFSPPAIGGRQAVAACIEIVDNDTHWRRLIPRCEQVTGVTQAFSQTSESVLPLRLSILGGDIGDPFYDLSNLSSWA